MRHVVIHQPATALHANLIQYVALSDAELEFVTALHERRRTVGRNVHLTHEGETEQRAFVLWDGWAYSYKMLADGARQVIDVRIPGDFVGLRSLLVHASDHGVETLTPTAVSEFSRHELFAAFRTASRFAAAVLWIAARDEAMLVEHIVDIGRRDAVTRTAHFMLELAVRLNSIQLGALNGFQCPLSQSLLADALGMSAIHLNRCLRLLRERGFMTFQHDRVTFEDLPGLINFAGFDESYLDNRPSAV